MKEPLWVSVMRMVVGLREVPGAASNQIIMQWARDIGAPPWFDNDDKPWCAVGMNRVFHACQMPLALGPQRNPYDLLRAKSFADFWGQAMSYAVLGTVLVFSRPEGFHVGLYVGERDDSFRVLGANQSNAIGETWISKSRLHAMRYPVGIPLPSPAPVVLKMDGSPVSLNER